MAKLEIALLAGAESKSFLASLTAQVDRLEKLLATSKTAKPAAAMNDEDEDTQDTDTEDDEDFAPKKKAAVKANGFDDDDDEDDSETEETEEETEDEDDEMPAAKPAKSVKAKTKEKAPTKVDVNNACKAYAAEHGIKATKALLKKKFKTESINEIPAEKYAAVIETMAV